MIQSQASSGWSNAVQIAANIATIINSIVVIASLIYLARQVKISTKTTKGTTYQTIINGVAGIEARISQDEELARIYKLGSEDQSKLDDIEKVRFNELISSFFNFYENLYFQAKEHLVDKELWEGWRANILEDLKKPGIEDWWN